MTARVAVVAAVLAGASLGAIAGAIVVQRSPTGYLARAVLPGERRAVPTNSVVYAAGVLTGQVDPFRHTSVQAFAHPPRLVITAHQLADRSALIEANGVLEAFTWRIAAERWRATGTLAIGDFDSDVDANAWDAVPPELVTAPAAVRRDPSGVGGQPGSLAFTCAVAGCGVWTRVFAPLRRGRLYVVSALVRAPAGGARIVVGVPGDSVSSAPVSGRGWRAVSVSWRPRADEPSSEVAVSTTGGGHTFLVDRVRIAERSGPAAGVARLPLVSLATTATPVHASRAVGVLIGALCGMLIACGGALCALLALRVRDRQGEAQQQPHA